MRCAAAAGWLRKASRGPRSGWEGRAFMPSFAFFIIRGGESPEKLVIIGP